jgi:hypothetical protein
MSRIEHVEQVFTTRRHAEAWFESLRPSAWPYVWCYEDAETGLWKVVALVERCSLPLPAGPRHGRAA